MSETRKPAPPLVPFLKMDGDRPYLAGSRCQSCGHLYVGERAICAQCCARNAMVPVELAERGKVYVSTVVYRSFPGVETPFVDVIVDLDDGAHLKGTLVGVEPDPAKLPADLRVKVAYHEVRPPNLPDEPYLTYVFAPAD